MRVHRLLEHTRAEGPGVRLCIWVQGCRRHCEGCFAADTWDPDGGCEMTVGEITQRIRKVRDSIDGITFLGGEPFEQAGEAAEVCAAARGYGLSVIVFTGGTYESLEQEYGSGARALLDNTDLLIDGQFAVEKRDLSRPLVGSLNQRFIFLTDRIGREKIESYKNRFEVRISPEGTVTVNGMGDLEELKRRLIAGGNDENDIRY